MNVTEEMKFLFCEGYKTLWAKENYWLPAFSPFPTKFSKGFPVKIIKSWDCEGKVNLHINFKINPCPGKVVLNPLPHNTAF